MTVTRLNPAVLAAALAAAALTAGGTAGAGLIGINFVGRETLSNSVMDPAETAGVVVQANWNNATGGTGTLSALVDETGAATGAGVQWRSKPEYFAIQNTAGDNRLMRGRAARLLDEPLTVTVSGLATVWPGRPYDVLVYFDSWNSTADFAGTYTIGSRTLVGTDRAGIQFDGTFVEDTGSGGNYVRFRDLTGDTFTLTAETLAGSGGSVTINAVQVYHAPDPATLGLMAFGLAAGRVRRRRA
ncbi:MAG TPA: PEP-CTERM sorting domain-containing protein [Phycisphaerae bacterium]|nr:PEP-CTERM sorting domain-containing protein [Phycisphaerae bacterium]